MKWYIRASAKLVAEMRAVQRRQVPQHLQREFCALPRAVGSLDGCVTQEAAAFRALDLRKLQAPWTADECVGAPLPPLLRVLRVLRAPWFESCEEVFRRVVAAQDAAARSAEARDVQRGTLRKLRAHPAAQPRTGENDAMSVEFVIRAVQTAEEEQRAAWAPSVQAFLDKYSAQFGTLRRAAADSMDAWWQQPAFDAADWAVVDAGLGKRPASAWRSEWRALAFGRE